MKKIIVKNKIYFIPITLLLCVFLLYIFCVHDGIFIFSGDSYEQLYQFYAGAYIKFYNGSLFSYDFSSGFGANPLSYSFYFLFSPFFYITLLFPRNMLEISFAITLAIKLLFVYCACTHWLKKISQNHYFIVCFSLLFTFSGWSVFYAHYEFFLDHLFVLPLLLSAVEDFLCKNNKIKLILFVAYIAVANYYFAYLFLAISSFYALYRSLCLKEKIIKKALSYLCCILLGLGIAAIVFIPNIYVVLNSGRLSSADDLSAMNKYELFKFIAGFFTPITSRLDSSLLVSKDWTRFLGWGNGVNGYMGVLNLYVLALFLQIKKNKTWIYTGIFLILGVCFYSFPIFSYMFQGTMDTRWFLYFNVFFCVAASQVFDTKLSKSACFIALLLVCISLVMLYYTADYFSLTTGDNLKIGAQIYIVIAVFSIIYFALWFYNNSSVLIYLCVLEVLFSGFLFFKYNETLTSLEFLDEYIDGTYFELLDDGSFYRIIQDGYDYWPSNNTYAKNIRGTSFYTSIYNSEMEEYLSRFKSTWSMPPAQGQDIAYSMIGAKYWITTAYEYAVPYGYELIDKYENMFIYENKYFIELGFGNKETINKSVLDDCSYFAQDLIMQNYIVTENSDNYEYQIGNLTYINSLEIVDEILTYSSPEGWYKAISNLLVIFENNNRNDLQIELYYYDELVKTYTFYDRPYFSIPLEEYEYITDIKIINLSEDCDALVKLYLMDYSELDEVYEKRKENAFYDTVVSNNFVQGKIDLDEEKMVYASIPYEKGWKVYIDGEEIEFQKVNLGFIGFRCEKGNHTVVFKYEIPYLKLGGIVSLISIGILIVLLKKKKL